MWEISVAKQCVSFFVSLALGGIFCVFYDFLRASRRVFKFKNIAVFFSDIFFFTVCAFVTFCFLLSFTQGVVRGYFIFGITMGFLIIFFSVSKFVLKLLIAVFNGYKTLKNTLKNFCAEKIRKIKEKIKNKRQKTLKKA